MASDCTSENQFRDLWRSVMTINHSASLFHTKHYSSLDGLILNEIQDALQQTGGGGGGNVIQFNCTGFS
jgi:hypothetical protein